MGLKYEIPDNSICVDGKFYQLSGCQKIDSNISWSYSKAGIIWATSLEMPFPYTPPEGYKFSYSNVLTSNGFTVVQDGSFNETATIIRIMTFINDRAVINGVKWTLVPKEPEED